MIVAGTGDSALGALAVAGGDRVDAVGKKCAALGGFRSSGSEADGLERAQTQLPGLAVERKAEDPGPRAAACDLEIEAVTVGKHAGLLRVLDRQRRQASASLGHLCYPVKVSLQAGVLEFELLPTSLPTPLVGIVADAAGRAHTAGPTSH